MAGDTFGYPSYLDCEDRFFNGSLWFDFVS